MTESTDQWTELYHQTADSNDTLMPSEPLPFVGEVETFLTDHDHREVLEAAAGEGRNSQRLVESTPELHVCDISEEALEICEQRAGGVSEARQADVQNLPYESESFDATLMFDALTHLRPIELVLRELARVTSRDGHVVFNMPIEGDDAAATGDRVGRYGAVEEYRYQRSGYDVTYMFVADREAFERLLSTIGLDIHKLTVWEWEDPPHPEYRQTEHHHENLLVYARRR